MEIKKTIAFSLTEEEKKAFEKVTEVLRDLSQELWNNGGEKTLRLCGYESTEITANEIDDIRMWLDWFPDCEDIFTEKEEKEG